MAQISGEQVLTDMQSYLDENPSEDAVTALPFETLDEYNTNPIGFGDVTEKLLQKVNAVFALASKYNRHSSEYLKSCAQLEKGIKYLGSSCLQKYALEKNNHIFPNLSQLNTTNLYIMASIHFQKIDKALSEYIAEKQAVDDALLDMEYRYYHLLERIRSTEVKIYKYQDKRNFGEDDYVPVIHGLSFSDKSWSKSIHEHDEPLAFQRAKAFSGLMTATRNRNSEKSDIENKKPESKALTDTASDVHNSPNADTDSVQHIRETETKNIQRGQFSRANSHNTVAETISHHLTTDDHAAEHVEKRPEDSALGSQTHRDESLSPKKTNKCQRTVAPEKVNDNEVPDFIRILQQASIRSRLQNLDYIGFTEREMRLLDANPLFAQYEPKLAAEIRRVLKEFDSG